ncbi:hypothetical protein GQ53DRAFT_816234 [Thozetella sp. PMI_491]|nr:hypothetical protein GQ53DRAFT_816234 [Thozetella sp. PMI_491]
MASQSPPDLKETLACGRGILCLGLPRTGSYSLVYALDLLGFKGIHHALNYSTDITEVNDMWMGWGVAGWACMPYMREELYPNSKPKWLADSASLRFNRADWDDLVGHQWLGVSDVGAVFGPDLFKVYPEAKVILVERDIDRWAESFDEAIITPLSTPGGWAVRNVIGPLAGFYSSGVLWDIMRAFFRAKTADEVRAKMKDRYREHYETVRNMVPANQLLVYKLGDGWEPLCTFLDRPVPNVPFPRLNDRQSLSERRREIFEKILKRLSYVGIGVAMICCVVWVLVSWGI